MRDEKIVRLEHAEGDIRFPYVKIEGEASGPSLGVLAGIHGSEYIGIEAAKRLSQLSPAKVKGTLKIVPVANVPAFLEKTIATCPVDDAPIAGLFPGKSEGGYSETLVAMIWDLMSDMDCVIDLHGGDMHETLTSYSQWLITGSEETDQTSKEMAEAFDMPFVVAKVMPDGGYDTGSFSGVSVSRGRPAILAEAGSHGETDEALIAHTHYRGLQSVMKYLGMLEGDVERKHTPVQLSDFAAVTSPYDGYFYPVVHAGETVWKDQILGEVVDLFTDERVFLRAPADAVVLGLVTSLPVKKDGLALGLGVF